MSTVTEERRRKGAFYTPAILVNKAYEYLTNSLGDNWQQDYIVWDMCCGRGNLLLPHTNPSNVFMSTLDEEDIDWMEDNNIVPNATKFQYDYLNDDLGWNNSIDYDRTNKLPQPLRTAISEKKPILVLINPPYAEAGNLSKTGSSGAADPNKTGISRTEWTRFGVRGYGRATKELSIQFLFRIKKEIPHAVVALIAPPKYITGTNFERFRRKWCAEFISGFAMPSSVFPDLKGKFPICFALWRLGGNNPIGPTSFDIIGEGTVKEFFNAPSSTYLNKWIKRQRSNNEDCIPLSNALTPTTMTEPIVTKWADNAIGYMCTGTNDVQNASRFSFLLSSVAGRGAGYYVTPENLSKAAVIFAVSRATTHTWLNDKDQYLQPTQTLPEAFKNDCLAFLLFNGQNLSAGANGLEWNGKLWNLTNHFIPYTEEEVNASGEFESHFMSNYIANLTFSTEAYEVLDAGRDVWRAYFGGEDEDGIVAEYKLNRPDVGWYQIRNALANRDPSIYSSTLIRFAVAYKKLKNSIKPKIYEYGFLR